MTAPEGTPKASPMKRLRGILHLYFRVRGREARPASWRRNAARTLAQTLTMWLVFLLALPAAVFWLEGVAGLGSWRFASPTARWAGAALFGAGWLLAWTSAYCMVRVGDGTPLPAACPRRLAIAGPYRRVRNPMAMGSLAQGLAVGLMLGSPLVSLYALTGALGWNFVVRPWEEHDLERRFGAEYRRYRDAVRCWIPRRHAFVPDNAEQ